MYDKTHLIETFRDRAWLYNTFAQLIDTDVDEIDVVVNDDNTVLILAAEINIIATITLHDVEIC
jgi:hypothetical protein